MYFYVVPKTMAKTVFDDFLSYNAMNIIFKASALTIQSFEKENSHFFGFSWIFPRIFPKCPPDTPSRVTVTLGCNPKIKTTLAAEKYCTPINRFSY